MATPPPPPVGAKSIVGATWHLSSVCHVTFFSRQNVFVCCIFAIALLEMKEKVNKKKLMKNFIFLLERFCVPHFCQGSFRKKVNVTIDC